MKQAEDFREESRVLAAVLEPLDEAGLMQPTLFKGWTIDDVLGHLHLFNHAAMTTLEGGDAFRAFFAPIAARMTNGQTLRDAQYPWLDGLKGRALFEAWRETAEKTADAYAATDPKQRVTWAGPEMSALSAITARQMETWAHGQEIFDCLGKTREEGDRVRNIAHLGVATYGWTFINRGLPLPEPAPYVRLTGPSGTVWEWNEPQDGNSIYGLAVEFAQVVAQTRNIADTALDVKGDNAARWMALAQCFAGAPEDPPAPGDRHRV
jgi:uncharacterized protein (TIGR03084 family)